LKSAKTCGGGAVEGEAKGNVPVLVQLGLAELVYAVGELVQEALKKLENVFATRDVLLEGVGLEGAFLVKRTIDSVADAVQVALVAQLEKSDGKPKTSSQPRLAVLFRRPLLARLLERLGSAPWFGWGSAVLLLLLLLLLRLVPFLLQKHHPIVISQAKKKFVTR